MSNKFRVALIWLLSASSFAQPAPQVVPVPIQPQALSPEAMPQLKPWPADRKLTIGELSAMQEAKEREALLNKLGYTSQARAGAKPAGGPGEVKGARAQKPKVRFAVTGIFGTTKNPQAEILVDGALRAIRAGDLVAGVTVVSIQRGAVVVKKGPGPTRAIAVGSTVEL